MNYEEMSDEELMKAYYECDANAFEELYRRWFSQLVGFFINQGWQPADAESLAEETLAKVAMTKFGKAKWDSANGSFGSWIRKIATNCARDLRRRKRRRSDEGRPVALDDVGDVPDAEVKVSDIPLGYDLDDCIRQLPEALREVILLNLEGKDYLEIAAELGLLSGTAGGRRSRALEALRQCMREKGYRIN